MGMAASQARLLALTSRMHDIELKAQRIQSQKLELANREDAVYEKYCEALDATKIQVGYLGADYKTQYMDACYANVCGFQSENRMQYSLVDNITGKVIVPQEIKDLYDSGYADKYAFAMAAIGLPSGMAGFTSGPFDGGQDSDQYVGIGGNWQGYVNIDIDYNDFPNLHSQCPPGHGDDLFMSEVEFIVFDYYYDDGKYPQLNNKYDALLEACENGESDSVRRKLLNDFRDQLYACCGREIIKLMCLDKQNVDYGEYGEDGFLNEDMEPPDSSDYIFDYGDIITQMSYYTNLWDQINSAGGCTTIDTQYMSGEEGVTWFKDAISSGAVGIYMLDPSNNKGWQVTTIATSVGNNYLKEVTDDDAAKKAEAEYNHELKIINRKDADFDRQLKKLETEETACKTEIESIKTVIDNNIQSTFKIFS